MKNHTIQTENNFPTLEEMAEILMDDMLRELPGMFAWKRENEGELVIDI